MATSADPLAAYYFEPEQQTICGREVTPITDEYVAVYPSVVDRFFTRYYYIKAGADPAPYQVLFHSNRICLICLAPEHPALREEITALNFDIGNADRSKNAVKGKGKKGGMVLQAESTLALLSTASGKTYKVPSCIRGKLVEVNVELAQQPQRLNSAPEGEGYFAIVLPKPEHCEELKAALLTPEQYREYLTKREKLAVESTMAAASTISTESPIAAEAQMAAEAPMAVEAPVAVADVDGVPQ